VHVRTSSLAKLVAPSPGRGEHLGSGRRVTRKRSLNRSNDSIWYPCRTHQPKQRVSKGAIASNAMAADVCDVETPLPPPAMREDAAWLTDKTTERSEDESESPANARERRLHGFLSIERGKAQGSQFALRPLKAPCVGAGRVRHLTRVSIGTKTAPAPTSGCNAHTAKSTRLPSRTTASARLRPPRPQRQTQPGQLLARGPFRAPEGAGHHCNRRLATCEPSKLANIALGPCSSFYCSLGHVFSSR
jgi:hypothetical protein